MSTDIHIINSIAKFHQRTNKPRNTIKFAAGEVNVVLA